MFVRLIDTVVDTRELAALTIEKRSGSYAIQAVISTNAEPLFLDVIVGLDQKGSRSMLEKLYDGLKRAENQEFSRW